MARQRAFTKEELLDATEALIIERGYEGFHLKALSEALNGARSTIYEYYSNKDEIVAACMRRTMERTLSSCEGLEGLDTVTAIKKLLYVFLSQEHLHKLIEAAKKIDETSSERARRDRQFIEDGHNKIKSILIQLLERAQTEGALKKDVPLPVIAAVFFHSIEIPNWLQLPPAQWAEQLFTIWWHGAGAS
ncbi:TetR/AcrR family transcriptional regulator [Paenibacillus thermotolerans]|uniref:TetR/AcrR family transcriptional regulator n=1 Tax=Paenibacillus thermotolerans TaxID=3027807 RepID=UPI002368CCE7|nr:MULTISPECIES: TetR/AcrR family transcriptional regulator [unclassified Paenibacillus]